MQQNQKIYMEMKEKKKQKNQRPAVDGQQRAAVRTPEQKLEEIFSFISDVEELLRGMNVDFVLAAHTAVEREDGKILHMQTTASNNAEKNEIAQAIVMLCDNDQDAARQVKKAAAKLRRKARKQAEQEADMDDMDYAERLLNEIFDNPIRERL